MIHAEGLPPFVLLGTAVLVVLGAALALIGSIGLLRLGTFYERVHAPTLGTTLGAGFVLMASMLLFTVAQSRPVLQEIVIVALVVVTTPVTYMLLVRAALYRDQAEGNQPTGARLPSDPESSAPAERRTTPP